MFVDVAIPTNNEKEFIRIAEALGTKALLFLYERPKDLKELQKDTDVKLFPGILARKSPQSLDIPAFGIGEQFNIENRNIRFLYGFESLEPRDSLHFKRSGLNQVLARMMKEKDKVLVFDMEKIITTKNLKLIGRMKQNLALAKKYALDVIICSFATRPENMRAEEEYKAFIRSMGFQHEAKKAANTLDKLDRHLR